MISLNPPKWTSDRHPKEFALRKRIFDTWRSVCVSFGYEEYLWPIVEYADMYRAKSWQDVWWSELTIITDRAWRELALRPEMTPSVTRMIAWCYTTTPKPIKYFSIANFFRNERPQRWRNREFWQLNIDCFGSDALMSDIEIIQIWCEIMKQFGAHDTMYQVRINNRQHINHTLQTMWIWDIGSVVRLIDRYEKTSEWDFVIAMTDLWLDHTQQSQLITYLTSTVHDDLVMEQCIDTLNQLGYTNIVYSPTLMRGFDYYDGVVFEFFDTHPDNRRAMFGGGRYNGLASIFGVDSFPAVGMAPGDETTKLFLQSRWLTHDSYDPEMYYMPILDADLQVQTCAIAQHLRSVWKNIRTSPDVRKLWKSLEYAQQNWYQHIIIYGIQEHASGHYTIKNLIDWSQQSYSL